ncbi:lytic transglycosylase domain-containing protein [Novosphingobium resinovorum]|uniref:lytic transglycosylase domain-containing protein n=1 Tax=Novosphingobium resinovorum TaxID=158500 RepID=UPI002ED64BA4|nr:lytic transglycosylase domain-containing protein [Novosphingobium resinovorum]
MKRLHTPGAILAVIGLALPSAAFADVMQVGASGAEWVAGGPAALPLPSSIAKMDPASGVGFVGSTLPGAPEEVEATPLEVDSKLHPQSITEALDAAGPTRWREHVAQLAAKYDISPTLLEAVVWQESRWNELAISPVGARGLAQLMPGTAAQMGVKPDDPMANLEGGARYLRMQLDAFGGNIEKALAAYNAGPARVTRAGGVPDIRETKAYVAAIMARLTAPVRQ